MANSETLARLEKIISEYKDDLEPGTLTPETTFESLDFDSLDIVDMMMACEDEFGVEIPEDAQLKTVQDLLNLIDKTEESACSNPQFVRSSEFNTRYSRAAWRGLPTRTLRRRSATRAAWVSFLR